MRRHSTASMGAMHPVIFFLLVYGIALFLALFVCRTVYYSVYGGSDSVQTPEVVAQEATAVAYH